MSIDNLPTFRKPPVVETVLGIQFDPIRGFTNAHHGAFWKMIDHEQFANQRWPKVIDALPLPPTFERFNDDCAWMDAGITFQLSKEPPTSRLQIHSESGSALVQLQNGRLHYNWIRTPGQEYARYHNVKPNFITLYQELEKFVTNEGLDKMRPNQWEITYVNDVPQGTVWSTPDDWTNLFNVAFLGPCRLSEVRLEALRGSWHFEIPDRIGRLHVDINHAKTQQEPKSELLRITLTARGPVVSGANGAKFAFDGLDIGRRSIVRTFKEITSAKAHEYWDLET